MSSINSDKKAQDAIDGLVRDIKNLFGDRLLSVYLYGSAAGKGYIPGRSNINILILLKDIDMEGLRGIASLFRKVKGISLVAPLVLTPDYIRSSIDVFPIEFLDIKESSLLLAGEDTLSGIDISLSNLRGQCEREIKGQLVRLRGSFLETEGDKNGMERLIATAVSNLIFPLKNILRLMMKDVPDSNEDVIKDCCNALSVADSALLEAWEIKRGDRKVSLDGLYTVISRYMKTVEDISQKIDAMKLEGRL